MNRINVSAGQTVLSEKSRIGLAQQMDSPIYYPDYYEIELSATHSLKRLMGTNAEVLIISGNATHAIETALISLIEPGESILSVNSGIFGQVFSEIASITGAKVCELKVPYGNAVQPSDLDLALTKNAEVKAVSIVHIETSTGVLAPLKELAEVVHKHNKLLIVDAVSSLGVTPLEMDKWGIDVLIGSGQKAINAPQGLAIIALSQHAIDTYASRNSQIKSVCLDLGVWREYRRFGVEQMLAAFKNESALPGLPK
jgi:aspartate aminotransferase-like enzyme